MFCHLILRSVCIPPNETPLTSPARRLRAHLPQFPWVFDVDQYMYVSIYIHIYTQYFLCMDMMCVDIHLYVYVYRIYTYTHIHIYTCTLYMYIGIYVCIYVIYMYVCIYMYVYMYLYVYICIYIYIYVYICIYIYICIYVYIVKLPQFIVSLTVGPQLPSWQSLFSHGLTCQGGCLPFAPWPQLLVHLQRWAAVRIEPLVGKQHTVFAGGGCC